MIEHKPWIEEAYKDGLAGMGRIAIVGYSHHRAEEDYDNGNFTKNVIRNVIAGRQKGDSFFSRVPKYFGYEEREREFWQHVLFFNFLPECIGVTKDKFKTGTEEQHERARKRFGKILGRYKPTRVFVFTAKGWRDCPNTEQEDNGMPCTSLGIEGKSWSWGQYRFGEHTVKAFGLHHPQYANTALMKKGVAKALSL